MPPSPTDTALLRSAKAQRVNLTVNAVPFNIVASAQVDQTDFVYPIAQLTVNNTSAGWTTEGMRGRLFVVGTAPGLHDITWGVLRQDATSNTLPMDAKYPGEPGYPRAIQQILANDYYVSIIKARPGWGLLSSIRNGVFFKNWLETYSNQNRHPNPIVRLGKHQQAWVDQSSGLARFTINADTYYFAGRSYASHQWHADGQTIISQNADTLVIDCEPGCFEIGYEVTDTQGKSTYSYRYLFANGPGFLPLNQRYAMRTAECVQDRTGCQITISFEEPLAVDELYPGQMLLITEDVSFAGGQSLSDDSILATNYVAYIAEGNTAVSRRERQTVITAHSPVTLADKIPIERQTIIEKATPQNWAEVTSLLSNPVGMFYYLTEHHAPYLIRGHDFEFDPDLLTLRRQASEFNRSELLGTHLKQLAGWLDGEGNIGSRADGTTKMLRSPLYMNVDARDALETKWTWEPGDIRQRLEHGLRWRHQVGRTFAGAFAFNGTGQGVAYKAVAPGFARSQAGGEASLEDTIVPYSAFVIDRVCEIAGHHHARLNPEHVPVPTLANRNLDIAQPCDIDEWHAFTIPASYDPLGVGWTQERRLCLQTTRIWTGPRTTRKEITHEWEPETFGLPGQLVPNNRSGAASWTNYRIPTYFKPFRPVVPDLGVHINALFAWNDILLLAKSNNFGSRLTRWRREQTLILDAEINPHSAYFSDPDDPLEIAMLAFDYPTGTLAAFRASFQIDDLMTGQLSLSEIGSWDVIKDSFQLHAHILIDPVEPDYWIVAFRNRESVSIVRSTDGGDNWETREQVGNPFVDSDVNSGAPVAIALYDERLIVVDTDGTEDVEGDRIQYVYTASTKAGALSKIDNPTDWSVVNGGIGIVSTSSVVVPLFKKDAPEPANDLEPVTFDAGTYSGSYVDIDGGLNNEGTGTSAFYPAQNNMAYGSTGGGLGLHVYCTVTVNMDAWYVFNEVAFWYGHLNGVTGASGRRWHYKVEAMDVNDTVLASYTSPESTDMGSGTITVTAAQLGIDEETYVWKVRVTAREDWDSDTGGGTALIFLDDIDIDATLVQWETDRAMYTLSPGSGTYTQRNSFQKLPESHYAVAVDASNRSNISMIATDETGIQMSLLTSTNGGQTWSQERTVPGLIGLKRNNDVAILFGYNRLELSIDGGLTSYSMLGDWSGYIGPTGVIKGIAGVL